MIQMEKQAFVCYDSKFFDDNAVDTIDRRLSHIFFGFVLIIIKLSMRPNRIDD